MADYQVVKRAFFRGPLVKKTTLSLSQPMYEALEKIALDGGYSVPELICIVLDQYLVQEAQADVIPWPEGIDPSKFSKK